MPLLPVVFTTFVDRVSALLAENTETSDPCPQIAKLLADLVHDDSWLTPEWRIPSAEAYHRQCLYEDEGGKFSIGCFVWAPHQRTPIHDHRSWGVIGALSGSITSETFTSTGTSLVGTPPATLTAGKVAWVHPAQGDIHRIGGGNDGGISIHVYGCAFETVCLNRYPD